MVFLSILTLALCVLALVLFGDRGYMLKLCLGMFILTLGAVWYSGVGQYQDIWRVDALGMWGQLSCLVFSGVTLYLGYDAYPKEGRSFAGILLLLALLGAMIVVASESLLVLYLGLELLALPTYALCVLDKKHLQASEAGLKYFVMGVMASIFILYGISFIYCATGSVVYQQLSIVMTDSMLWYFNLGVVFLLAGMCFKLGVAPFHMWVPDIYQSAPMGVVYWVAIVPKIALGIALVKLCILSGVGQLAVTSQVLGSVSVFSIVYGVLMALRQQDLRRLMAYASVAHMGFVLWPLQLMSKMGYVASLVYMFGYVCIAVVIFGVIVFFYEQSIESVADLSGVAHRYPYASGAFLLALAAMAGIPPLLGFVVKLNVLYVMVNSGYIYTTLLVVAAVMASAYYYMHLVRCMYFTQGSEGTVMYNSSYLLVMGGGVLLLGVFPQTLLVFINQLL